MLHVLGQQLGAARSALKDRDKLAGDGKCDHGYGCIVNGSRGGAVQIAACPGAIRALLWQDGLLEFGIPFIPRGAPYLVHGVAGVVMAVPKMMFAREHFFKVLHRLGDLLGAVPPAKVQDTDPRRGSGEFRRVLAGLIGVTAGFGISTGVDIGKCLVQRDIGHMEAGIAGRP